MGAVPILIGYLTRNNFVPKFKLKLNNMNYAQLKSAQIQSGYHKMQEMIDSGLVWRLEGSMGREAMSLLEMGACMLPKRAYRDCYGNTIPSRDCLKKGTKGTYHNSLNFYKHL